MMRIVVNTVSVKKRSGGAYQIALNFLRATLRPVDGVEWVYWTSADVDAAVGDLFEVVRGKRYFVFPTQPDFLHSYRHVKAAIHALEEQLRPDVVYSISSPCYISFRTPEVMRFANAWVTNPTKNAWAALSLRQKVRMSFYCIAQRRLLGRARYVITQTETVRKGILRVTHLPPSHVGVVANVLPQAFQELDATPATRIQGEYDVACVAAPVPHKNLRIIPRVLRELSGIMPQARFRFHVTIPSEHPLWAMMKKELGTYGLEGSVVNHGYCTQRQLAAIYRACQFCFLPSHLETFSASSLEGMYFGLFIVATDYEFNHDVIGPAGLYFSPTDAADAACRIADIAQSPALQETLSLRMKKQLSCFSDYQKSFESTVAYLKSVGRHEI